MVAPLVQRKALAASLKLALACVELVSTIDKHDNSSCTNHAWHNHTCKSVDCKVLALQGAQIYERHYSACMQLDTETSLRIPGGHIKLPREAGEPPSFS